VRALSKPTGLRITIADVAVACGLVLVASYLLATGGSRVSGSRVELRSFRGEVVSISLDEARTIEIQGPRGTTLVAVGGGCVRFVASPCPHKVCIERGAISRSGEWIACVPNGVIATIEGERAYDGITP
jgi:hypothetical protein